MEGAVRRLLLTSLTDMGVKGVNVLPTNKQAKNKTKIVNKSKQKVNNKVSKALKTG